MALSADTNRVFEVGTITTVPVKASAQIYLGSAVGFTSGYARALVAGDDFAGFALENKLGTTDGAVNCAVSPSGQVSLSISSIAVTDIGKPVYASADGTFTLTQTSNSKIGTVSRWVSTGVAIVRYEAQGAGADLTGVTVLTDSSGGAAANGTIDAVTVATAITNSSGSAASNGTIEAVTPPTAITDNTTGTTTATWAAGVAKSTYSVYLRAAAITGNVLLYTYTPGYKFKILRISASCVDAVTTGAKAATLTTAINAVDTTGGIVILSGTYALGVQQASSAAITAANTGTSAHAITVTASSVTAFAEGGFMLHLELQNMDTADALTGQNTYNVATRAAIVALTDSIGEFATAQTANIAADTALRSAVTELATKQNEVINALK